MRAVAVLLSWFRPSPVVEDLCILRLEGIEGHRFDPFDPRVQVFASRKRAVMPGGPVGSRIQVLH